MENLRKTMYDAFKIDPVHTFGLPTLTKSITMIRATKDQTGVSEIELLQTVVLYRFFDESKLGGEQQQHAVASNCPGFEDYDEDEPTLALEKQDAVLLHIALVEPIMRDLSPMPDGVDPDERTVFSFFRSTGNGMQFDVNKPLGLAAQRNLYLNAVSAVYAHEPPLSRVRPRTLSRCVCVYPCLPRQIRMAYPTGVRDGTPIVDIPFSK
eukprot:CAMPEP_0179955180 /NCGR_PEP_ID=MMETSP0983-20121128/25990_1 /TAXON_ID=483367 /ORGANISM="non described non described, Strain CCMP 2436" /LENGTH=208 /DNA_ID=CAMNT_0021866487 /DNA_START=19 /DNA_END=643 /DNA_ORIENTATION=-